MEKFINRDLSWIEFNNRVLQEGLRKENPLMERLKFLTIVSTNFDEFFKVRVASLKHQLETQGDSTDISGEKISEILKKISKRSHQIQKIQMEEINNTILNELSENNFIYVKPENYSRQQSFYTQNLFHNEIFPLLTPVRTEDENFPQIPGENINTFFLLSQIPGVHSESSLIELKKNEKFTAIVPIPSSLSRIIWLPSEDETKKSFTMLDDIILTFGTKLFPGLEVEESMIFSISRDADFGVNEDSGSHFVEAMEEVLENRHNSSIIRLCCNSTSKVLLEKLKINLKISEDDIYECDAIHPESLLEIIEKNENEDLNFPAWKNYQNHHLLKSDHSIWEYLDTEDEILTTPYESFDPVEKFITEAADDSETLAIKMTLYRTEKKSEIVKSLIRAARNGIHVTVFVELKARFDEERNIDWASKLEKAGVIVIHGIANLKVHSKAAIVIRRSEDRIHRYVHLSTGNYNAKTAKIYSDVSLFTSNPEIANDITLFFNTISGYSAIQTMKKIFMAPVNLKSQLITMINREIEKSTQENPGLIIAKMNSLGDPEIIEALYKASQSGVKILLNVRGICQLIPGVKGLSENIRVVSIVGRYLEHGRIFYFKNSGYANAITNDTNTEEIYLSSADWMPRNLERRVELMFPILSKKCFKKVKDILMAYFEDTMNSSELCSDGRWKRIESEKRVSAQEKLHEMFKEKNNSKKKNPKIEFEVRRKN